MTDFMDKSAKEFILAAEIASYLHDLGKLHPAFLVEKTKKDKNNKDKNDKALFREAHGAVLDLEYSPLPDLYQNKFPECFSDEIKGILKKIKNDPFWQEKLQLEQPEVKKSYQAKGLGDPLRIHHAKNKAYKTEKDIFSLLGDIVTFGADGRDSALDKGSGFCENSNQKLENACLLNAFGKIERRLDTERYQQNWLQTIKRLDEILFQRKSDNIGKIRNNLLEDDTLKAIFSQTLAETRYPTNDVTLYHHSKSVASLTKPLLAEFVLRNNKQLWQANKEKVHNELGALRHRLLAINWDWQSLLERALTPLRLHIIGQMRQDFIIKLQQLIEIDYPLGNLLLSDDQHALFVVPAFYYQKDQEASEKDFKKYVISVLENKIPNLIQQTFGDGFSLRLCWSESELYITGFDGLRGFDWQQDSQRQTIVQATHGWLQQWQSVEQPLLCPQCGLYPGKFYEKGMAEAGLIKEQDSKERKSAYARKDLCEHCNQTETRYRQERKDFIRQTFGFSVNPDINQLATGDNPRIALLEFFFDESLITSGTFLLNQQARPLEQIEIIKNLRNSAEACKIIEQHLNNPQPFKKKDKDNKDKNISTNNPAEKLIGDQYWGQTNDSRILSKDIKEKAQQLAKEFFAKELQSQVNDFGIANTLSEQILAFGLRKHASLSRIQRTLDGLGNFLRKTIKELHEQQIDLIPLDISNTSVRFLLSAEQLDNAVKHLAFRAQTTFDKMDFALAPQLSIVVFRKKFPLYIALEALGRMRQRGDTRQVWQVEEVKKDENQNEMEITWRVPSIDGEETIIRSVPLAFEDNNTHLHDDIYHSYYILQDKSGPDSLVHVSKLKKGDKVWMYPRLVDFIVLDTSARRFDLRYRQKNNQLWRKHWVMGENQATPWHLDNIHKIRELAQFLQDQKWDSSRRKHIFGELVETREKWVRDVPEALRQTGMQAYKKHALAIFARYLDSKAYAQQKNNIQHFVETGQIFDLFDWVEFIGKN